jgi:hypothetical protein
MTNTAVAAAITGTLASISNIAIMSNVTQSIVEAKGVPSGFMLTFGGGGGVAGFGGGLTGTFYLDLASGDVSLFATGEVGLAPLSVFLKQRRIAGAFNVGVSFNAGSASDFKALGYNAAWPATMLKSSFPLLSRKDRAWFYWLRQLASRSTAGTKNHKSGGSIGFGYSTSGAAFLSYGLKYNSFASTVGVSSEPHYVFNLWEAIDPIYNQVVSTFKEMKAKIIK